MNVMDMPSLSDLIEALQQMPSGTTVERMDRNNNRSLLANHDTFDEYEIHPCVVIEICMPRQVVRRPHSP